MVRETIHNYLLQKGIEYDVIRHARALTAEEIAHTAHIPAKEIAKTVVLRIDGILALAVLHANERVDLERLGEYLGTNDIQLCSEEELEELFPDCELGAMPPFGDLYRMPVIVSESVASSDRIVCNAGTHTDLLSISYASFARAVKPMVGCFTSH